MTSQDQGNCVELARLKEEEGAEMPEVICPKCYGERTREPFHVRCTGNTLMRGIITHLTCGKELPFTMLKDHIIKIDTELPAAQSDRLNASVPDDIKDDVKEAERANYYQCYKACVTMCRRALKLGLIDRGIPDGPLGVILGQAKMVFCHKIFTTSPHQ